MSRGTRYRCPDCGAESVSPPGVRWPTVEEGGEGVRCGAKVKRLRPRGGHYGAAKVMKWGRCGVRMEIVATGGDPDGE